MRKLTGLLAAALALTVAAGCARQDSGAPGAPAPAAKPDAVEGLLKAMTLEEKAGQLIMFGFKDKQPAAETAELVRAGKAGGIILFGRNVESAEQVKGLTGQLQTLAKESPRKVPLLIAIDQEGGTVTRLVQGFTVWPGNMALGAAGSEALAGQAGEWMGRELAAVGVNLNLAPVVDVNANPKNPIIGVRSFGEDPAQVSKLATAMIRGMQKQGVLATAKHFPGHGDTDLDSHFDLPAITADKARLEALELAPFKAAVAADVGAVMSAHLVVQAVDPQLPGTLSPAVMTDLLRRQVGFQGLAVTDAIDTMKAITDNFKLDKALVMAINAGNDMVVVTESFGLHKAVYNMIFNAIKSGELKEERVTAAARNVLKAKARLGLLAGVQPTNGSTGTPAGLAVARQVATGSITVLKNEQALPIGKDKKVYLMTSRVAVRGELANQLKAKAGALTEVELKDAMTAQGRKAAVAAARDTDVYILASAGGPGDLLALYADLLRTGRPVVAVALKEPYDLGAFKNAHALVATYGWTTPSVTALVDVLTGAAPAKGRLPVGIPGLADRGAGL